jgi:tetratricopeptide repeat protein
LREETLAIQKVKLGPNHPSTLISMHNLANSYGAVGRHADALKLLEETLALRKAQFPPDHRRTLETMWGIAYTLTQLGRGAEAVAVIDDCLRQAAGKLVDPRMVPVLFEMRLRHFEKTKNAKGCQETAQMWEALNRGDAASLYRAGCIRAVTAAVLRAAEKTESSAKAAAAESDRAMAWLQKAAAAGFKDAPRMAKDSDLAALREREDFKKLLAELEAKTKS